MTDIHLINSRWDFLVVSNLTTTNAPWETFSLLVTAIMKSLVERHLLSRLQKAVHRPPVLTVHWFLNWIFIDSLLPSTNFEENFSLQILPQPVKTRCFSIGTFVSITLFPSLDRSMVFRFYEHDLFQWFVFLIYRPWFILGHYWLVL